MTVPLRAELKVGNLTARGSTQQLSRLLLGPGTTPPSQPAGADLSSIRFWESKRPALERLWRLRHNAELDCSAA